MNDDQTLSHDESTADSPFGDPDPRPTPSSRQWSVAEALAMARRPERETTICLRADLEADHARLVRELSTLITPSGELVDPDTDETPLGQESPAGKAERLSRQLADLEAQMRDHMWTLRFRGLPSDEMVKFQKQHMPTKEGASLVPYQNRLIAASAIAPLLSLAEVEEMRTVLGVRAMGQIVQTAIEANTRGGIDIPFSPSYSPTQARPESDGY